MMPSRGLMPVTSAARIFAQSARTSSRSLSTSSRPHLRAQLRRQYSPTINLVSQRNLSWSSFGLGGGSTSPAPSQAENLPPTTEPQAASTTASAVTTPSTSAPAPPIASTPSAAGVSPSSVAPITPDSTAVADAGAFDANAVQDVADNFMSTMPEQIGCLKSIGLDYGWGPTSILEYLLEHVHVYSGLPWWGSIILTAIGTRVVMFPLFLKSSDTSARQQAMAPMTKPIQNKMMEAYKNNDAQGVQQIRLELKRINEAAGIRMRDVFLPLFLQGTFAYCALKLMRGMSNLPVPGFLDGGFLWITDLSVADPTFALPVIMAGTMHMFVRFGGETGMVQNTQPGLQTLLLYGMPALILVSMSWFPAAVNLWLSSTGLSGILQAKILQRPGVRDYFNLAPMVKPPTAETPVKAKTASPATIDVKGTSRNNNGDSSMRYQAPDVKYTASTTHSSTTSAASLPMRAPGLLERGKEKAIEAWNDLGERWTNVKNRAYTQAQQYSNGNAPKSKTRSSEFIKRAQAYEKSAKEKAKARR